MKIRTIAGTILLATAGMSINAAAIEIVDLDNDGIISLQEIMAARQAAREEILNQFDVDGDGELSEAEKSAAQEARQEQRVTQFDENGDGELTRDERQAAREERQKAFMANLDTNDDGELSDTEQANLDDVVQARSEGRRGNSRGNRRNR